MINCCNIIVEIKTDLAESRFVVETRTAITMTTCTDLEVERTVYPNSGVHHLEDNGWKTEVTHLSFSVPKIEARYSAIFSNKDLLISSCEKFVGYVS